MDLYLSILKLFLDREVYLKYKDAIDVEFLRTNAPELYRVFKSYEILHRNEDKPSATIAELEAAVIQAYPKTTLDILEPLVRRISESKASHDRIMDYLESSATRAGAAKLGLLALDYAEGKVPFDVLSSAITAYSERSPVAEPTPEKDFVSDDIELLYEKAVKEGGLRWRLGSLNRSLGPLRKGDFGFIFARPETGKTTFLADQVTFMASQAESTVLWINNEEQGEKVGIRCYESALGATLAQVLSNKRRARDAYLSRTKGNLRIKDDAGASRGGIEKLCSIYKPSLIVIDQLDKVKGFDGDREDLRMGAIYQWARELAKGFAPVIGVSQADGSGEGIKYLTMGNVANAKTAKQAEADWILGIGFSYEDPPNVRGFSICKNKLLGGEESVPKLRHARWDVLIEPEIGRYADVAGPI